MNALRPSGAVVPEQIAENESALLTREEFISLLDPDGKSHASEAYPSSIASFNRFLLHTGAARDSRGREIQVMRLMGAPRTDLIFVDRETGETVATLKNNVFYHKRSLRIGQTFLNLDTREHQSFAHARMQETKYPEEHEPRVDQRAAFPVVLKRTHVGGEALEVRAEIAPRADRRDTIAVLNAKGELIAMASDEWGATLLRVAKEYQGRGIGKLLGEIWYQFNPRALSGGFTQAGRETAIAGWERAVRKALSMGWYSELVRQGRLSRSRVNEILAGLGGRRRDPVLPEPAPRAPKPDLRLYVDEDELLFVLYDARFFNDQDDEHVLGYGFLRDSPDRGVFFYRIEYEPPYKHFVSAVGLQLARYLGSPLFVAAPPADMIDWQLVQHAKEKDGYVKLRKDVLPVREMAKEERALRNDPFRERESMLIEAAESKWA